MKRLLIALTLLLASLPSPASANHYWGGMHWQRGGPGVSGSLTIDGFRYIGVHNGMDRSPAFQALVNDATERWNDHNWHAAHLTPSNLPEDQFPYPCDWTPPPSGWGISLCYGTPTDAAGIAQTQVTSVGAHFTWVKIVVRPGASTDVMDEILTHELGHALGLSHNLSEPRSIMATNGGSSVYPTAHDKDVVARLYSHAH